MIKTVSQKDLQPLSSELTMILHKLSDLKKFARALPRAVALNLREVCDPNSGNFLSAIHNLEQQLRRINNKLCEDDIMDLSNLHNAVLATGRSITNGFDSFVSNHYADLAKDFTASMKDVTDLLEDLVRRSEARTADPDANKVSQP